MSFSTLKRFSLCLFLLLLLPGALGAKVTEGLLFRSYEVNPEERTSLILPAREGESLSFKDSLGIRFCFSIDPEKGRFGYVCRIFPDASAPVDLLVYTTAEGNTYLGVTGDHQDFIPVLAENTDLTRWNEVRLLIVSEADSLSVQANGRPVCTIASAQSSHSVKLHFGMIESGRYKTTDVAPMTLKNLEVRSDRNQPFLWPLNDPSDLVPSMLRPTVHVQNPLWRKDFNRNWRKAWTAEMPSATAICPDPWRGCVYFISDGVVTLFDIGRNASSSFPYARKMNLQALTSDFTALPDGRLAYVDVDGGQNVIFYDQEEHEWSDDNPRTRKSLCLHHNMVFLEKDSSYVHLFGYGHHRYDQTAHFWHPDSGVITTVILTDVPPRYLCAAGVRDGIIYLLGGKGNRTGKQELGIEIYRDFIAYDPEKQSTKVLWTLDEKEEEVAAADLLFEEDSSTFLALTYNPDICETSLQLKRFSFEDGSSVPLADPIPYRFIDISSEARLMYDPESECYAAALCSTDPSGRVIASVYLLDGPILSEANGERRHSYGWLWGLLSVLLAILGIGFGVRIARVRRRNKALSSDPPAENPEPEADIAPVSVSSDPGIHLLGRFRVIDREREDITPRFSPLTEQFLSILILYTAEHGGISNSRLKGLLWSDKSDESYNNNRGVTLKKIRNLLQDVGPFQIVSKSGLWQFVDEAGLCDFLSVWSALKENPDSERLLCIADKGPLMPDAQFEWLDPFKAAYTEDILSRLIQAGNDPSLPPETKIRIADARLRFDSLDEDAVRAKCQALLSLKRLGTAQWVFSRFAEEYQRIMGEPFAADFKNFIKS